MAAKKYYLIRVWSTTGNKIGTTLDNIIETSHSGFDLLQEKVIPCYESHIKNLYVLKGLRATYEEVKKPKEAVKTTQTANTTK